MRKVGAVNGLPSGRRVLSDSRAGQIIALLARRGSLTIAELGAELGVTTTAVRQQVNRLLYEGWIERGRRHKGPGRPADVLSLSEQGRRLFAGDVGDFARLLLDELTRVEGPAKVHALLKRVFDRLNAELVGRLGTAGDATERVQRLAALLAERGTVADATATDDGVRLSVYTCPYHGLSDHHVELCELERETLSRLTGHEARLTQCLVSGHSRCEFQVALRPAATQAADEPGSPDHSE